MYKSSKYADRKPQKHCRNLLCGFDLHLPDPLNVLDIFSSWTADK